MKRDYFCFGWCFFNVAFGARGIVQTWNVRIIWYHNVTKCRCSCLCLAINQSNPMAYVQIEWQTDTICVDNTFVHLYIKWIYIGVCGRFSQQNTENWNEPMTFDQPMCRPNHLFFFLLVTINKYWLSAKRRQKKSWWCRFKASAPVSLRS